MPSDVLQISISQLNLQPSAIRYVLYCCTDIEEQISKLDQSDLFSFIQRYRSRLDIDLQRDQALLSACVFVNVLLDLLNIGWSWSVQQDCIYLRPPIYHNTTKQDLQSIQSRVARDLKNTSQIREFVRKMETPCYTITGKHSVCDLFDDGQSLANALTSVIQNSDNLEVDIRQVIDPYIQFVEADSVCEYTGLRMLEVFHYLQCFTNSKPVFSVLGRSVRAVIRNAARPNHPIMGAMALHNSLLVLQARDRFIGWTKTELVEYIRSQPDSSTVAWLLDTIQLLINRIYVKDLYKLGVLTPEDIEHPSAQIIQAIYQLCKSKNFNDKLEENTLDADSIVDSAMLDQECHNIDWERKAVSPRIKYKRYRALYALLCIRHVFQKYGISYGNVQALQQALQYSDMQNVISRLAVQLKRLTLGTCLLDLTLCIAVPPYNVILGGKLTALLACSPTVTRYYKQKYANTISVVASSVKGSPVIDRSEVAVLVTQGLYGKHTSLYNRIKVPLLDKNVLEYKPLGCTVGYGTAHFSEKTISLMRRMHANSTSTRVARTEQLGKTGCVRFHQIRDALKQLRIPAKLADRMLRHEFSRIIYIIPLTANFRDILLSRTTQPAYFFDLHDDSKDTEYLISFWIKRWLLQRIQQPEIIEKLTAIVTRNGVASLPELQQAECSTALQAAPDTVERLKSVKVKAVKPLPSVTQLTLWDY